MGRRALELSRGDSNLAFRALTALNWVQYHSPIGEFGKAGIVVDEMRKLMNASNVSPVVAINASMSVCTYELLSAQPSYRHKIARVLELAQSTGMFMKPSKKLWKKYYVREELFLSAARKLQQYSLRCVPSKRWTFWSGTTFNLRAKKSPSW